MEKYIESLFPLIGKSMADFASRIVAAKPAAKADIGHYANSAFLLRSYARFRVDAAGEEVAVTVEVKRHKDGRMTIASDVCLADGAIVIAGPALTCFAESLKTPSNAAVSQWYEKFEHFLRTSEPVVLAALSLQVTAQAPQHSKGHQDTGVF